MQFLSRLLGDVPLEDFLSKHFTKLPLAIPRGASGMPELLNWDVVKQILGEKKSMLRVVRDGQLVKDDAEWSFEEARGYFHHGCTLLVRFAEKSNEKFREIADEFSRSFKTPVDIQLYCTPEGHNAFGWHYDVEEVFILQMKGSKEYTIRPNTIHPNPLVKSIPKNMGYENEKTELQIKVLLKEGDVLYIPSGWWHRALTQSESMHISIGLMPSSAVELVKHLADFLPQFPLWRTRLPIHKEFTSDAEALEFFTDAFKKLGEDLKTKVSSPEFIHDFLSKQKNL
jgi:50S ribosomal protein L16 3-hydroxylase